MTYIGRTRLIRMERAEKRFEAPVWRRFIHPRLIKIEMLRSAYPHVKTWALPDERAN